jgi:putative DNA primase/helicase
LSAISKARDAAGVKPAAASVGAPTSKQAPLKQIAGGKVTVVPDLLCLADVEPMAVPWLWYGRIALGRITLLVGRPGGGKSFLTCDLAARISTGAAWPCGELDAAPHGDTLLIAAEDDPADTIAPRLIAAGANLHRVHLLKAAKLVEADGKETAVAFDLSNVELIRDALAKMPECKLVVIDPIGSYLGGRVDAHRENEVRAVLAPLAALAREKGVAVLLVCHTRKATADFADDTILGSRAFVGLARQVLHLSADTNDRDRKLLLPGKSNLCAPPAGLAFRMVESPPLTRLEWEPEPLEGFHADDAMTAEGGGTARGQQPVVRSAAKEWLSHLLAAGPVAVAEVKAAVQAAGLSWSTVRRAQEDLGVTSRKRAFCDGWEWSLPVPAEGTCAGEAGRRCPTGTEPEHLRDSSADSPENVEGAQHTFDLSAFAPDPDVSNPPPDRRGLPD